MTTKQKRPQQQNGILTALLVAGSLTATVAGTRLLAAQEAATAAVEITVSSTEPVTVVVPAESATAVPLPPNSRGVQIELPTIPQVVQPQIQPVARTRSSR